MDKISRYFLITVFLGIFLVVAPLIVLYVSGTRLNLGSRDYEPTGILTIETKPDGAEVYIDNRTSPEKTPATVRFLPQAEYGIKITKPGYFDWYKKLPIELNKVTYAHNGVDAVHLIKEPAPALLASSGVTSFALIDGTVWYGTVGKINWTDIGGTKSGSQPLAITPRNIASLRGSNTLLLSDEQGHKIILNPTSITSPILLPQTFARAADIHLTGSTVIARVGLQLLTYNINTEEIAPLINNITGFTMLGDTAYVAHREQGNDSLQTLTWNGTSLVDAQPLTSGTLPETGSVKLFITPQKELFAYAGTVLYRINERPEPISSQLVAANFDHQTGELTYRTASELWFYNFKSASPQLLTRSTSGIHDFAMQPSMGYGFIATDSGLVALEIDSRHQQNQYRLIDSEPVWKVSLTDNAKTAVVLAEDKLVTIPLQ